VVGRLPVSRTLIEYRNVRNFEAAKQLPGVLIFRFDGPLHFANKASTETKMGGKNGIYLFTIPMFIPGIVNTIEKEIVLLLCT
jgi:MFS superfamily sulfate permease-like transporter